MVFYLFACASPQVAGNTHFHRHLLLCHYFHEFRILAAGKSVPNTLRADIQCAPYRLRPGGFTCMRGQTAARYQRLSCTDRENPLPALALRHRRCRCPQHSDRAAEPPSQRLLLPPADQSAVRHQISIKARRQNRVGRARVRAPCLQRSARPAALASGFTPTLTYTSAWTMFCCRSFCISR